MTRTIPPGIRLIGPALLFEQSKTLVMADLHLGAEASLVNTGVLLPRTQQAMTMQLIRDLTQRTRPRRIVLNGDIKHDFGTISEEEWRDVLSVLDELQKAAPVTVIKGNHDAVLQPILKKRGAAMHPSLLIDGYLIIHGDRAPDKESLRAARGVVIGHEHPSVVLDDGIRKERYKCFLIGQYAGKELIILPSTYPLVEGSDVLREEALG
ncbi:metallophosphoesterase, partial [Candidatus Woesearchaeota archaeon]|nr:metallophosphoesterase [Candidatus Woesearchaeota archaeon]